MAILGNVLKSGIKVTNRFNNTVKPKPLPWQKKTLKSLLTKAKNTQIGIKYDFHEVLNSLIYDDNNAFYSLFKEKIPIYDYNSINEEWWHLTREGVENVTWPGVITHFALSSGTSGAPSKAIPVSQEMIKAIQKTSINQIISLGNFPGMSAEIFEKGYLMLGGSTQLNQVNAHYEGDLSGITAGTLPLWFQRFYKPGKKISAEKDWSTKLEEITENAKNWDIGFLAGVPAWMQILLEKIIERYDLETIHDIWPNLTVYAWGGVSFEPYKIGFQKLLGKPINYLETYLASEGFIAYQRFPNTDMQLNLKNGIFFEFIPFNQQNFDEDGNLKGKPNTLMINEVEENKDYALLITTCAGAWRYLIGDTIRFTNKELAQIKITGRTKHFLSLCGEHLSVDNMNQAVEAANQHFNINIKEFTVLGIKHPPLFAHQWYIGTDDQIDPKVLGKFIDDKLKEINDDYPVERQHALKNVFFRVLPTEAFLNWMKHRGKEGGQNKFPRVIKGDLQTDWENFVKVNYPGQII